MDALAPPHHLVAAVVFAAAACCGAVNAAPMPRSQNDEGTIAYQTVDPPSWAIPLTSSKGRQLLFDDSASVTRTNSLAILSNLQTQMTQTYCGVASAVTALNSMANERSLAPLEPQYWPFAEFTQNSFFQSECVLDVATPKDVSARGLTLQQLTSMIQCYEPKGKLAKAAHAKTEYKTVDDMRDALVSALNKKNVRIIINYLRREWHGGHFSPLAAYNVDADMFLIADVERFLYPPVWMSAKTIFDAVTTTDSDSKKSRGFIFIEGSS